MMRPPPGAAASVDPNIVARLRAVAARTPDRAAFVFDSAEGRRQISFAELWESVDRAGAGLRPRWAWRD